MLLNKHIQDIQNKNRGFSSTLDRVVKGQINFEQIIKNTHNEMSSTMLFGICKVVQIVKAASQMELI